MRSRIRDKVQNALDEARLLVLGTQVLLGLEYRAAFEPGFEKLPTHSQYSKLCALTLLVITLALLIWPGAYHRIVAVGEDTEALHEFTTRVMEPALALFGFSLGIEVFVVFAKVLGTMVGVLVGVATGLVAMTLWYVIETAEKKKHKAHAADSKTEEHPTKLRDKINHVLTEAKVVLPGAQALLGFQLVTVLMDSFDSLPPTSKYLHLISLSLIALTIILLMTPAAYHRIVERGEETEHFHRVATWTLLTAMVPLAMGICGDFFVVARKITQSTSFALVSSIVLLSLSYGLWFGLTTYWRNAES